MASVARAIEQAASCAVDESLWWDSHECLFHDLDDFVSESRKVPHDNLVQKLQANHLWLLNMLLQFKEPSSKSRSALDVGRVVLGDHTLEINAEMKSIALELSEKLVLDEVQAYILVNRFCSNNAVSSNSGLLQKITMNYFMERQCLLKCTRLILLSHLAEAVDKTRVEMMEATARKLARDGLENKEYAILSRLLKVEQPLQLDLDISHLWAEEIITEVNLVMDILFLIYYQPLCPCSFDRWNELFFMFQEQIFTGKSLERLSLTAEALGLAKHVKHQALLILFETLDFDKLLLLVFGEVSFSRDNHPFSMEELQQMDGLFANVKAFDVPEAALLLLGWGTFCCLVLSLPVLDKETKVLETEYTTYVQQAYEAGAFQYLLDMLHHKGIQESSIDGYGGVVKSLLTCFITAFDIVNQTDSALLDTLVDILYAIYSEQEILCVEFWDRDNALDGPVRNLLFALQEYFPYRLRPFLRLLAGLAKGAWPAECVFDFLYKMSDVASPYLHCKIGSPIEDGQSIVTTLPLEVPGAPGLIIPAGTNGHIVKVMDKQTVIARWKCKYNALAILLTCLMDSSCLSNAWPEVETIVILLHQMLSSNKLLANYLLRLDDLSLPAHADACTDEYASSRINVLAGICVLLDKLMDGGMDMSVAAISVEILSAFTCCCPAKVMFELSKSTVVGPQWSSAEHLGEGLLVKILTEVSRDVQQSEQRQKLICSVVELSRELVEKGVQSEALNNIVVHIVGTSFVNHLSWRYSEKFECWRMTAKIFRLGCRVLYGAEPKTADLRSRVLEIMVVDGSFHDVILKIVSVTAHDLEEQYYNRYAGPKEIEWFQKALTYGMTLLHLVLLNLPGWLHFRDGGVMTPIEHAVLHHAVGTMSFIGCIASLVGFFQNPDIQLAAVKLFAVLCVVAQQVKPHPISISSYLQDAIQRRLLRFAIGRLYSEESSYSNVQLFDATIDLSKSAAKCQPSLIELLFSPINSQVLPTHNSNTKEAVQSLPQTEKQRVGDENNGRPLNSIWEMMKQGVSLFESQPHTLCGILSLLASLWEGGAEYHGILEDMRNRDGFWNFLTGYVSRSITQKPNNDEQMLAGSFQFQCQTAALQIMAYETFLHQFKLAEESTNQMYSHNKKHILKNTDSKSTSELPLAHWSKVIHPSRIISSFVRPLYDSKGILRAKAEMRALFVALLLKIFMGDDVGLSITLVKYLQRALNDVLNHASFQEILSTYSYHGYGSGKDLQALVLSDLYFHLQGELEAGRHIPGGSFKNLVDFLGSFSLTPLLHQRKKTEAQGLPIEHIEYYIYDTTSLRQHLGLEWCPLPTSIVHIAAESTLDALQHANGISCLTFAQISALESLHNLLSISDNKNKQDGELASLKGLWAGSCILELCTALDFSVQLLTSDQDSADYIVKFLAAQSRLLLLLVGWFCSCGADNQPNIHTEEIFAKVIRTIIESLRSILGSFSTIILAPNLLIGSLLGAYLLCLEVMQPDNHRLQLSEHKSNLNQWSNEDSIVSMEFLPLLCSFVEIKAYAKLATAAMTLLIRHFLSPQAWLPILQTHFPIQFSLSLLRMTEDMDTSYQLLSFFLSLLHVKGGVKILDSAALMSHILLFLEQLKEELLMEGPFHVSSKRAKRNELWSLCVAIIAASARTVCQNDGPTIENAFLFFESQKEQLLQTLQSPSFSFDTEGNKRAKLLHPQTSIMALQRTQQVLHLLIELRRHNAQWFHVVGKSEMDFCEKCIHLLAYIAREGLLRNVGNVIGNHLLCPPTTSEEIKSHNKPSSIRCLCGWFAITARGASFLRNTTPNTSQKPNEVLPPSMASDRTETDHTTATKYSDAAASDVYKVALLMLEFLCKQAQHTVKSLGEGGLSSLHVLPEFPAPEILYGLQDQAMSIISEVCLQRLNRPMEEEARQVCSVLFSIVEKAVFLEVCVARICGICPSSMRSENFIKEFKNFLSAIKGHQFLDTPSKALKSILGLAYPALT